MAIIDPRLNPHLTEPPYRPNTVEVDWDKAEPVYKPNTVVKENPKHIQQLKEGKTPFEVVPLRVLAGLARVMKHGADKYGKYNWREQEILASTYKAAILRHLVAWSEGQSIDPDSGEHHLYHIMACCVVALDARLHDTIKDDLLDQETK